MSDYTFVRISRVDRDSYDPVDQRDAAYWGYLVAKEGSLFNTLGGAKSSIGHSKRSLKGLTKGIVVEYEKGTITDWERVV